jgi:hypothetical protein
MDRRTGVRWRTRVWVFAAAFLMLSLALPAGLSAQVTTPEADGQQYYVDPTDRYAVPIPTNWSAEEHDGYVVVATNDGKIAISAAIVEASGATPAIDAFLRLIEVEFDSSALETLLATPSTTEDSTAFYTFDDGSESGQLLQALGRKLGDDVFVLVLQGDFETVKLRQVQVDKIFEGILIRTESSATPVASPEA